MTHSPVAVAGYNVVYPGLVPERLIERNLAEKPGSAESVSTGGRRAG
jgi:hypothetical protein